MCLTINALCILSCEKNLSCSDSRNLLCMLGARRCPLAGPCRPGSAGGWLEKRGKTLEIQAVETKDQKGKSLNMYRVLNAKNHFIKFMIASIYFFTLEGVLPKKQNRFATCTGYVTSCSDTPIYTSSFGFSCYF